MVVYDQALCSKSSITADTASRKDLTLQGCTKVSTGTSTLFARSVNIHPSVCQRGLSHDVPRPKASTWGPPHQVEPATKSAGLRDGLRVWVDGCERQQIPKLGLSTPRKCVPILNSTVCSSHKRNKAVKHGISTG